MGNAISKPVLNGAFTNFTANGWNFSLKSQMGLSINAVRGGGEVPFLLIDSRNEADPFSSLLLQQQKYVFTPVYNKL
jgi:hypothetical protein